MNKLKETIIIGGGLAGSEAAWQAAEMGISVQLYEMRPKVPTAVHRTGDCAELVCSNSLGSNDPLKAPGLLKEELRRLNSLVIRAADQNAIPAGQALAVDREKFSKHITEILENHPRIRVIREEAKKIPDGICVIASGPLTSSTLASALKEHCDSYLYYYDAVSPVVLRKSLDMTKLYEANRYGHGGESAYLNASFTKEVYEVFIKAIRESQRFPFAAHEDPKFFEACMPVEEKADQGIETMRFGAMKPVGLRNPETGKEPYAVVQLRPENAEKTLYSLVGFQTRMRWGEQARVFRMIRGFENAEFVRFGVMHRNIFVNAPLQLLPTLQLKTKPNIFLAGQITGVEGYVEDIASGLLAGVNAARMAKGDALVAFPAATAAGALMHHITHANPEDFQPMNVNFGLFPPLEPPEKNKMLRKKLIAKRALEQLEKFKEN